MPEDFDEIQFEAIFKKSLGALYERALDLVKRNLRASFEITNILLAAVLKKRNLAEVIANLEKRLDEKKKAEDGDPTIKFEEYRRNLYRYLFENPEKCPPN